MIKSLKTKVIVAIFVILAVALALTGFLIRSKYETTYANLTQSRYDFVVHNLRRIIQTGFDLDLALGEMANLHEAAERVLKTDKHILSVEIYAADGTLLADHQNLPPEQLKPDEILLHRFFHNTRDLVQLSNIDDTRPEVLDYFVGAYTQWLDQGADALRIDTIGHVPNPFWHDFAQRLRQHRPGLYMFGERYSFDPPVVAQHTWPENGAISVLDFPLKGAFGEVFEKGAGFEKVKDLWAGLKS